MFISVTNSLENGDSFPLSPCQSILIDNIGVRGTLPSSRGTLSSTRVGDMTGADEIAIEAAARIADERQRDAPAVA